jgi:hypothetical protein
MAAVGASLIAARPDAAMARQDLPTSDGGILI